MSRDCLYEISFFTLPEGHFVYLIRPSKWKHSSDVHEDSCSKEMPHATAHVTKHTIVCRTYTMHPHGVEYTKTHEGAAYIDGPQPSAVAIGVDPGKNFLYRCGTQHTRLLQKCCEECTSSLVLASFDVWGMHLTFGLVFGSVCASSMLVNIIIDNDVSPAHVAAIPNFSKWAWRLCSSFSLCMHVCTYVCMQACMPECTIIRSHLPLSPSLSVYIHTYISIHTYIYTYIHTQVGGPGARRSRPGRRQHGAVALPLARQRGHGCLLGSHWLHSGEILIKGHKHAAHICRDRPSLLPSCVSCAPRSLTARACSVSSTQYGACI
jgi:hypothetical protein